MQEIRPDQIECWGISYDALLGSMDVTILIETHTQSSCEGDSWYLLQNSAGDCGFLVFGWGSCPGCDAAEAVENAEEATQLRDTLWRSIRWHATGAEMHAWLASFDWGSQYFGGDKTFTERFLPAALAYTAKEI